MSRYFSIFLFESVCQAFSVTIGVVIGFALLSVDDLAERTASVPVGVWVLLAVTYLLMLAALTAGRAWASEPSRRSASARG